MESNPAPGSPVFAKLRRRLTFANVVSVVALFVALGGSSYAAVKLNGKNIKNRTIAGAKLKNNTVTGTQVNEGALGPVPNADRVGGARVEDLRLRCPEGTTPFAGSCFETSTRGPAEHRNASLACGRRDGGCPPPTR